MGFLIFVWSCLLASLCEGAVPSSAYRYYQKLTGDEIDTDQQGWELLYRKGKKFRYGRNPAPFLVEAHSYLAPGRALDLGMGEGRNAVYLAKKGFEVDGVDISESATRRARKFAKDSGTSIRAITADLNRYKIRPDTYDLIIVFYYLNPNIFPQIYAGLKKGGIVVFENNSYAQLRYNSRIPKDLLVAPGEIKSLFKNFQILTYREIDDGESAFASVIAKRL